MIDLFKNKSVAFIGQSPILEGKGLGKEIDSFDVVYRTNCLISNTDDYGAKCDVVSILTHHIKDTNALHVPNIILFDDIDIDNKKYVVTPDFRNQIIKFCIDTYGLNIIEPTAGMIAYFIAKNFECSRFKFFGITGYQNLKGEVVNHGVVDHYTKESDVILHDMAFARTLEMASYDAHNFKNQNDVFRSMVKTGEFEMDQYSLQYFKPHE